ncbi:MAG: hypothetical protein JWL70_1583, partial [Acidimicrobiia bacterium]|nr:hypothetical protein [Acidimicrobiia bacterium]
MLALRRVRRVVKSFGAPVVAGCISISVLAGCLPGSQSEATVDPNATANARAVLRYLDDLPNQPTNKILSGQQAVVRQYDLYDTDWSAVHNLTGQTPA